MQFLNIPDSKPVKRIVIIGAGFAGIELSKGLKNKNFQVVLIDRNNYHTFQPLLYQVATGGLESNSIAYPIRRIVKKSKNLFFRMADVTGIIPESNSIETSCGIIEYDYLVVASGSEPNYFSFEKVKNKMLVLKTVPQALDMRSFILQNFESALLALQRSKQEELLNIVIVGGGPTGIELAGALAEMKRYILPADYPELDFSKMQIYVIEALDKLLSGMSLKSSEKSLKYLNALGVKVILNSKVVDYNGQIIKLANGQIIFSDTVIWTAGVKGSVLKGLNTNISQTNRFRVNRFSQINNHENIFAIGDVAAMSTEKYLSGHPMLAVVAIQQARHLARNFIRLNQGKTLVPFSYRNKGTMVTIGKNKAVVDLPFMNMSGVFAWFVWMFVHLMALIGFRNRLVVFIDWVWNYLTYDRALRLIIRPYKRV
jgi:NADH dehydrogenase